MIGVVLGPGWMILRIADSLGRRSRVTDDRYQPSIEEELTFSIVTQLAQYGRISSSLLGMFSLIPSFVRFDLTGVSRVRTDVEGGMYRIYKEK